MFWMMIDGLAAEAATELRHPPLTTEEIEQASRERRERHERARA